MANKHILTVEEFKELARPTSKHVDEDEVIAFVRECEDIHIIPAVGLEKYQALLEESISEPDKILLEGGIYEKDGKKEKCAGLKTALAYFVYAKMAMADGSIMTRSGMVQHNDSYAERTDDKNRVRRYDDVMFQSPHPRRVRLRTACVALYWFEFQSTHPRRVRLNVTFFSCNFISFQSTHPRRVRPRACQ